MADEHITIKKSTYKKLLISIVVVLVAASFMGGYVVGGLGKASSTGAAVDQPTQPSGPTQGTQGTQAAPQRVTGFTIPSYVSFQGSNSAALNVIEFGDYQCPFCERFFSQTEPQIIQNYVSTNKAKFYFMDYAFLGPDSNTLSEGAWCANDQGKYYAYHDYMYGHQGQEGSGWATADKVKALAANIAGLDTAKFNSCLDAKTYASRVTELTKLGQNAGVTGTPSVLIGSPSNGYTLIVGACPYSTFQKGIDAEMAGKSWSVGNACNFVLN